MAGFVQMLCTFVAGFTVSFVYGWKLTLVVLSFTPLLAVSSFVTQKVIYNLCSICFENKCENYKNFSSESFHFLVVKFLIYLNRRVFVM